MGNWLSPVGVIPSLGLNPANHNQDVVGGAVPNVSECHHFCSLAERSAAVGVITATAAHRISRQRSVHARGCAVANPPESDEVHALIDVTQLYLSPPLPVSERLVQGWSRKKNYSIAGMHGCHYDVSQGASTARISLDIITALAQQNALEE
jgi:hypothetical protein